MNGENFGITVITPVLNRAAELEKTLCSVLAHARRELDYIVIDGGSTDGSVDLIRARAPQLKCWVSEPDRGVYDAMNKGWALAAPDSRILFLGAGDELRSLPWKKLEGNSQTVLYGNVLLDGGKIFYARCGLRLKLYNALHHQALLVPKSLHPASPFDLTFPNYADFDFNQRLQRQGARFCFSPDLLAYASPAGLTGELHLPELSSIVRKNYGRFWSNLTVAGFTLAKRLPLFSKLRPIH